MTKSQKLAAELKAAIAAEKAEVAKAKKAAADKAKAAKAKAAAAAKAKAAKAKKAAAAEAKAKGSQVQTIAKLVPVAKEINTRLEKAEKLAQDAFDHRLAAAIFLGDAKKDCAAGKVNFKQWCDDNINKSYETVRKLAAIGVHPESEARVLLQDLRDRTKASVAKGRKASAKASTSQARSPVTHAKAADPYMSALETADNLDDKKRMDLAREIAAKAGLTVSAEEPKQLIGRNGHTVKTLLSNIMQLTAVDRLQVLEGLAKRCGVEIVLPKSGKVPGDNDDLLAIPDFLKRSPAVKAKAKRSPAKKAKAA